MPFLPLCRRSLKHTLSSQTFVSPAQHRHNVVREVDPVTWTHVVFRDVYSADRGWDTRNSPAAHEHRLPKSYSPTLSHIRSNSASIRSACLMVSVMSTMSSANRRWYNSCLSTFAPLSSHSSSSMTLLKVALKSFGDTVSFVEPLSSR